MQDRVPLYPGRVTLTPVEGQTNTYDMVRADQPTQAGTPLSKANLLKDTTAAQFGLDSNAVPDDVFSWVGKYNEYWWSLLHGEAYSYYEETKTPYTFDGSYYYKFYHTDTWKCSYSSKIEINETSGEISLVDPVVYDGKAYADGETMAKELLDAIKGKYVTGLNKNDQYYGSDVTGTNSTIFYIPENATISKINKESDSGTGTIVYSGSATVDINLGWATPTVPAQIVTSTIIQVPAGETTYEHSTDRNAYPDSGNGVIATKTMGAASEQKISCVIISGMQIITSVEYSSTYEYDMVSGAGVLGASSYVKIDAYNSDASDAEVLRGKYFTLNNGTGTELTSGTIYYATDSAVVTKGSDTDGNPYISIVAAPVTFDVTEGDGITYTYLGRPFEKLPTLMPSHIEHGNYVGTGTYGNDSPNLLTFSFKPLMILISKADLTTSSILLRGNAKIIATSNSNNCPLTWTDNGVSWYYDGSSSLTDKSAAQLNKENGTYNYIALG